MRFLVIFSAILWVFLGTLDSNAASMYSWTDENGVTNLSNRPPPENARDIKVHKMYQENEAEKDAVAEKVMQSEPEKNDTGEVKEKLEKPKNSGQEFLRI
jgi:hypothetical protein